MIARLARWLQALLRGERDQEGDAGPRIEAAQQRLKEAIPPRED